MDIVTFRLIWPRDRLGGNGNKNVKGTTKKKIKINQILDNLIFILFIFLFIYIFSFILDFFN